MPRSKPTLRLSDLLGKDLDESKAIYSPPFEINMVERREILDCLNLDEDAPTAESAITETRQVLEQHYSIILPGEGAPTMQRKRDDIEKIRNAVWSAVKSVLQANRASIHSVESQMDLLDTSTWLDGSIIKTGIDTKSVRFFAYHLPQMLVMIFEACNRALANLPDIPRTKNQRLIRTCGLLRALVFDEYYESCHDSTGRKIDPESDFRSFFHSALCAANIPHPDPERESSSFLRVLRAAKKNAPQRNAVKVHTPVP